MGYFLYTTVFLLLVCSTVLYLFRDRLAPYFPDLVIPNPFHSSQPYSLLPTSSSDPNNFAHDAASGLSSTHFDLNENLLTADQRAGLDNDAKREILRLMRDGRPGLDMGVGTWAMGAVGLKKGLSFDEARRAYMQERFKSAGISADGRPRDPKFVSFS